MAPSKTRFYGIDVIRLLSFMAIVVHHFIWVIWYAPHAPPAATSLIWASIENFARLISFSGHTILFLTTFLIARAETRIRKTLIVIALVSFGWFAFSLFEYTKESPHFWYWDIYPLIIVGLITGLFFRFVSPKFVYAMGVVGFLMTLIPFWNFEVFRALPLFERSWLIGDCEADLADWPILPWIGFVWIGYAVGTAKRHKPDLLSHWHRYETYAWPVVLLSAVPFLGAFFNITIGSQFGCFSFRQPPQIFWGHFVFVLFFWRVSLLTSINEELSKSKAVRWIASLRLSTMFGLAYLIHYTIIELYQISLKQEIDNSVPFSIFAVLAVLPATELILRVGEFGFKAIRGKNGEGTRIET